MKDWTKKRNGKTKHFDSQLCCVSILNLFCSQSFVKFIQIMCLLCVCLRVLVDESNSVSEYVFLMLII